MVKDIVLEKEVNDFLAKFGTSLDGRPKFRLVWSPDIMEKRTGEFEYSAGNIHLGTTIATREVPKYTYLSDCYVIEELVTGVITPEIHNELPGSYEPLYTFESAAGVPLPLSMKVVDIVMYAKMHPRSSLQIRTDIKTSNEVKERKLHQLDIDSIDTSVLQTRLHFGESNFTKGIRNKNLEVKL